MTARVVPLLPEHWPGVAAAYAAGIAGGDASFESEAPTWDAFDAAHLAEHRFVALVGQDGEDGEQVAGWVAASPTSSRAVYAGVVEESVYVHPDHAGLGLGRALLERLVASTETAGIWTLQAGIFPENAGSLRLHERLGFRTVGVSQRVGLMTHGYLAGHWRDVVRLERRSAVAGLQVSQGPLGSLHSP